MAPLTLTKDNASSLIFKCDKSTNYYKYEIVNFKKSIIYAFQDPVNFKQCLYSVLITKISDNDLKTINEFLGRVNDNMEIEESTFIKSKDDVKTGKGMITVEIFGYKRLEDLAKPMWRIRTLSDAN